MRSSPPPPTCHVWFAQFAHVTPCQLEWDVKCLKNQTQSFFKPACQIPPLYIQMRFDFLTVLQRNTHTHASSLRRLQGEAVPINLSRSFHFRVNYIRRHIHDHLLREISVLYARYRLHDVSFANLLPPPAKFN